MYAINSILYYILYLHLKAQYFKMMKKILLFYQLEYFKDKILLRVKINVKKYVKKSKYEHKKRKKK